MKKEKLQLIWVEFLDHKSSPQWQTAEEIKDMEPATCYACGFLAYEDENNIKVSCTRAEDGDHGDVILIIKSTIVKRINMSPPKGIK